MGSFFETRTVYNSFVAENKKMDIRYSTDNSVGVCIRNFSYSAPVEERNINCDQFVCLYVRLSVCVCLSASIFLEPPD